MSDLTTEVIEHVSDALYDGVFAPLSTDNQPATAHLLEPIATSVLKLARSGHPGVRFKAISNLERWRRFSLLGNDRTVALSVQNPNLGRIRMPQHHEAHLFGRGGALRLATIMVVVTEPSVNSHAMLLFDRTPLRRQDGDHPAEWDDGFIEMTIRHDGTVRFGAVVSTGGLSLLDARGGFEGPHNDVQLIGDDEVFRTPQDREQMIEFLPRLVGYLELIADRFTYAS